MNGIILHRLRNGLNLMDKSNICGSCCGTTEIRQLLQTQLQRLLWIFGGGTEGEKGSH